MPRVCSANLAVMSGQFKKLGVWLDFDDPYQTMDPEYIEAAWWTIQRAAGRGMLERGFRVVNWCPRCATAIADAEVEYWDETDPSVFVKFPVIGKKTNTSSYGLLPRGHSRQTWLLQSTWISNTPS